MNLYDKLTDEQAAMDNVYTAIESLDYEAKLRVLDYVRRFCEDAYGKELAAKANLPIMPS